jgi:hypothetical protein
MTKPALFKKKDLDRALQCATEAGLAVSGIEFDESGFRLTIGSDNDTDSQASKALESWLSGNANHH